MQFDLQKQVQSADFKLYIFVRKSPLVKQNKIWQCLARNAAVRAIDFYFLSNVERKYSNDDYMEYKIGEV